MSQLVVRKLPEGVKDRLRARAERAGRSLEAEVRDILVRATEEGSAANDPGEGVGRRIAALFADIGFTDGEIVEVREPPRHIEFG